MCFGPNYVRGGFGVNHFDSPCGGPMVPHSPASPSIFGCGYRACPPPMGGCPHPHGPNPAARETAGTLGGAALGATIGGLIGNVPGALIGGVIGGAIGNAASRPW